MTTNSEGTFNVLLDAPSDVVHQGGEVEIDTTDLPEREVMPVDYDPGRSYAVDPDVSPDGLSTAS